MNSYVKLEKEIENLTTNKSRHIAKKYSQYQSQIAYGIFKECKV